jgi:hypothetical protein
VVVVVVVVVLVVEAGKEVSGVAVQATTAHRVAAVRRRALRAMLGGRVTDRGGHGKSPM